MPQTVCYEQPLNERARSLLRLEFLFRQVNYTIAGQSTWDSRAALQGLFDILALTGRNEFKRELLKELERHAATLNRLRPNPGVHAATLDRVLAEIGAVIGRIHQMDSSVLEVVRQNDFLSAIHQRSQVPGGTCRFDLPALHHWLQRDPEIRARHLREWLAPFAPLQDAVALVLRLVRESAVSRPEMACQGFYQRGLTAVSPISSFGYGCRSMRLSSRKSAAAGTASRSISWNSRTPTTGLFRARPTSPSNWPAARFDLAPGATAR